VAIDLLRGRPDVVQTLESLDLGGIPTFCTAVTWAELFAGVRPGEEELTRRFLEERGEVELDRVIGRTAGAYLSRFSASHGVQVADALIAAAAVEAGLHLWTRNRRHYPMPDLEFFEAERAE
jgi:predicted nucleic acid-binding protein